MSADKYGDEGAAAPTAAGSPALPSRADRLGPRPRAEVTPGGTSALPPRAPVARPTVIVEAGGTSGLPAREPRASANVTVGVASTPGHKRRPYWVDNPADRSGAQVPPATKRAVLDRDGWRCSYCGTDLTLLPSRDVDVDHVDPRADGAPALSQSNLAASCSQCNRGPGGKFKRNPEAWRQWRLANGWCWPPEPMQPPGEITVSGS